MTPTIGNPFIVGQPLQPAFFYGHGRALNMVLSRLANQARGSTSVIGSSYIGRSTFLRYLVSDIASQVHPELQPCWPVLYEAVPDPDLTPNGFWGEVFLQALNVCKGELVTETLEKGLRKAEENCLLLPDIRRVVDRIGETGKTLLLAIDDFDHLISNKNLTPPQNTQFFEQFRHLCQRPGHGLAMVISTYLPLVDLWKYPHGSIFFNIFTTAPLGHLSDAEVDQVLDCIIADSGVTFTPADKAEIRSRSGNLPVFIQFYAGQIYAGHLDGLDQDGRLARINRVLADPLNTHIQLIRQLKSRMNKREQAAFERAVRSIGEISAEDKQLLLALDARGGLPPGVKI
jgi:hypothetical protein